MNSGSSGLSEKKVIEYVSKVFAKVPRGWIGVGDDTALIKLERKWVLFTIDVLNENTHFIAGALPPFYMGWKVVAINVSDIGVKGGKPIAGVLFLNLPEPPSRMWIKEFMKGTAEAGKKFGVKIVGGNTSRGELSVGCAMLGILENKFVKRHSAKKGDFIYIAGNVGFARKGFKLIRRYGLKKAMKINRTAVNAFVMPVPPVELYRQLLRKYRISASVDVSDSLYEALSLLLSRNTDALLEFLPLKEDITLEDALYGGEDYAFVFTSPCDIPQKKGVVRIGRVVEGDGRVQIKIGVKVKKTIPFSHF